MKKNKQTHLSMCDLESLGFELVKSYTHDEFMIQRRRKGLLTIETTWLKTGEFESQDLTIEEINCINFTGSELKILDNILNKK
jgi:hypothetical protein